MATKIYGYPKCSTCVKAQKFMNEKGLAYKIVDITQVPPSKSELKDMLKAYHGNIKKLLNTSGQVYREMNLSAKLPSLSEDQVLDLLHSEGKLVKRPFLLVDGKAKLVGFKEEEWQAIFA